MSKKTEPVSLEEESEVAINRRSSERKKVRVAVTMSSDSNLYVGFADNMSEGGLFVATHELLPVGTTVDLQIRLPDDDEPLDITGKVRWQRPVASATDTALPGFGVEFQDLTDEEQEHLEEFLEDREPIFHPS